MIFIFFLHDFVQILFRNVVMLAQILSQLFLSPMAKGTPMMLIFLGSRSRDDVPAILGPFLLPLADQPIGMLDVVHVRFKIRS